MGFADCASCLLITFNFIFWLSGAGILGVGIYLTVDKDINTYVDIIHIESGDPYLKYSAYILIAFGSIIFLVGFCGCCGALRKSECLLGFYIFFLVLVMGGELTAGVLTAVYKETIEEELSGNLKMTLQTRYNATGHMTFTSSWDYLQVELGCCGVTGPGDYKNSQWVKNNAASAVPITCCVMLDSDQETPQPKDYDQCLRNANLANPSANFIHKIGCKDGILNWFRKHSMIVIGVGCGIAGLELFGLVFAICLCCKACKEED